ncbi:RHS repeat-associated core domain-containing protein [Yersinia enterocolitica]|uniref:RHS repeat-associated core domain-containing protein n=1 Tax=Yersinia enterocolitica TaxID=630 RepID=UPI003D79298E
MTDIYFTQAGNFADSVGGNVDPRTGLFSASIKIADITGNDQRGPQLPLTLQYTPFSTDNCGLGAGWSFNWTRFDTSSRTLFSSSGERFKTAVGNALLLQQKLKTINFQKNNSDSYQLVHRSGAVEILKGDSNAFAVKVPDTIYSPLGTKLTLIWTSDHSDSYWIKSIKDDNGTLLDVDYSTPNNPVITVWPGSADSYSMTFMLHDNQLAALTNGDSVWQFNYDSTLLAGYSLLYSVGYPGGLLETAHYQPKMQRFPNDSSPAMPCVNRYVQDPQGGQPALVYTYEFSEKNFLGFGCGITSVDPNADNLFNSPQGNYQYSSTTRLLSAGETVITKRVYDKFHLLISQTVTQADCVQQTDTEYYAQNNMTYEQQSDIYQFTQNITTTYSSDKDLDSARNEQEITEFDDLGNITYKKEKDGTVTQWIYYPLSGEAGKCPATPNSVTGMRWCKTETVTPPASEFSTPVHQKRYTYTSISAESSTAPFAYFIVPALVSSYVDGELTYTINSSYTNRPGTVDHGRVSTTTETYYDDNGNPYANRTDYTYGHDSNAATIKITRVFTGFDGTTSSQSETLSTHSGLSLLTEDQTQVKGRTTYDRFGRILTQTIAADSPYAQLTTNDYTFEPLNAGDPNDTKLLRVIVTDPRGNRSQAWYDGANRNIKNDQFSTATNKWYTVTTRQYNDHWQQIKSVDNDFIFRSDGRAPQQLSKQTDYSYDNWGNISLTVYSDGRRQSTDYDPVKLVMTESGNNSNATKETQYNISRLPLSVTTTDSTGHITVSHRKYDGLQRLRSSTDEVQNTTLYQYDRWDRVCSTTYADGTVVAKTYAPQGNSTSLVNSIAVNERNLGKQTFDGMQRCLTTTNGGRTTSYHYKAALPSPNTITLADGSSLSLTLIPELGMEPKKCVSDEMTQSFVYQDGVMTSAIATSDDTGDTTTVLMGYDSQGRLTQESVQLPGDADPRITQSSYSLAGAPVSYRDSGGQTKTIQYDALGRPIKVNYGELTSALSYDSVGRLTGWTAGTLAVALTFDSLEREKQRVITDSADNSTLTLSQTYTDQHLLKTRTTALSKQGESDQNLVETYLYDSRNRLQEYVCQGELAPIDPYGNRISGQSFTYDALSNVTQVITQFGNQQDTATFHYGKTEEDDGNTEDYDPCQLRIIEHSHRDYPVSVKLSYNSNGQMKSDETGATLHYDDLGRLAKTEVNGNTCLYGYDALGRLVSQLAGTRRQFYYERGNLVYQLELADNKEEMVRWLRVAGSVVAQSRNNGQQQFFSCDDKASVLISSDGQDSRYAGYAPYGSRVAAAGQDSQPGYNGERFDGFGRVYHLGNGYRAYSPELMRFTSPDSLSPFGAGGVNAYAYCDGDPINGADPSGHLSWGWVLGLAIGGLLASIVTGGLALSAAAPLATMSSMSLTTASVFSVARVGVTGTFLLTSVGASTLEIASAAESRQQRDMVVDSKNGTQNYDNGKAATTKKLEIGSLVLGEITGLVGLGAMIMAGGARWRGWGEEPVTQTGMESSRELPRSPSRELPRSPSRELSRSPSRELPRSPSQELAVRGTVSPSSPEEFKPYARRITNQGGRVYRIAPARSWINQGHERWTPLPNTLTTAV